MCPEITNVKMKRNILTHISLLKFQWVCNYPEHVVVVWTFLPLLWWLLYSSVSGDPVWMIVYSCSYELVILQCYALAQQWGKLYSSCIFHLYTFTLLATNCRALSGKYSQLLHINQCWSMTSFTLIYMSLSMLCETLVWLGVCSHTA